METERLDKIWGKFIFWPLDSRKITAQHNLTLFLLLLLYITVISLEKQKKNKAQILRQHTSPQTQDSIPFLIIHKTEVKAKHPPL